MVQGRSRTRTPGRADATRMQSNGNTMQPRGKRAHRSSERLLVCCIHPYPCRAPPLPMSPQHHRRDANSPCKRCAAPDELEYDPGPHSRQTEALEAPAIRFQSTRTVETDARTSSEPLIRNSSRVKGWSSERITGRLSRYAGALSQGVGCHTVVSSDTAARRKHGAETEPVYLRSVTRHSDKMPHRHVSMLLHSQRSGGRPP